MFDIRRILAVVLGICLANVHGQDPDSLRLNYSEVFKDMPALFERIMEMLHDRPEVLETDDILTFQDNESANDKVPQLSSADNELRLDKRESNFKFDGDFGKNEDEHQNNRHLSANDEFGGFVGSVGPGGFHLTADEVAERMLMVERKLDEYNNDTNQ